MKNISKNSVAFRNFCIFALALQTQGRQDARHFSAGFFYAPVKICGSVPPCGGLIVPLPLRCNATGKAEPFFFSQHKNILQMHYTEKQNSCATCAQKPNTAEQIVSKILDWDDPENIREDLHSMMLAFFMHDNPTVEFKERIYCSYTTLYHALKQMEVLNPRRKEVCHANA